MELGLHIKINKSTLIFRHPPLSLARWRQTAKCCTYIVCGVDRQPPLPDPALPKRVLYLTGRACNHNWLSLPRKPIILISNVTPFPAAVGGAVMDDRLRKADNRSIMCERVIEISASLLLRPPLADVMDGWPRMKHEDALKLTRQSHPFFINRVTLQGRPLRSPVGNF